MKMENSIFMIRNNLEVKFIECKYYSVKDLDAIYKFYDSHKDFKIVTIEK